MLQAFVLNRAEILERLGDDEEIYASLRDMFLEDYGNNCQAMSQALTSGDAALIKREIHTVKGLLATFSDEAGAAAAQGAENQVRDGDLSGAPAAVTLLRARLEEVAGVLRSDLG